MDCGTFQCLNEFNKDIQQHSSFVAPNCGKRQGPVPDEPSGVLPVWPPTLLALPPLSGGLLLLPSLLPPRRVAPPLLPPMLPELRAFSSKLFGRGGLAHLMHL